jgi:hypothetical protein
MGQANQVRVATTVDQDGANTSGQSRHKLISIHQEQQSGLVCKVDPQNSNTKWCRGLENPSGIVLP